MIIETRSSNSSRLLRLAFGYAAKINLLFMFLSGMGFVSALALPRLNLFLIEGYRLDANEIEALEEALTRSSVYESQSGWMAAGMACEFVVYLVSYFAWKAVARLVFSGAETESSANRGPRASAYFLLAYGFGVVSSVLAPRYQGLLDATSHQGALPSWIDTAAIVVGNLIPSFDGAACLILAMTVYVMEKMKREAALTI